ncbi:hypothetical protein VZT92_004113 [Zoarces viviparus]|uniref:Uncharacterized protein n=1 Tax=Zoarces viviparus TaxID=48416 RepID=A0AAW1FX97_ZOAVI
MNDVQQQGSSKGCKVVQSKSPQCAHEDGLAMPDRRPFESKFLTGSLRGRARGQPRGIESLAPPSKSHPNPSPGATGCADK